MSAEATLSAYRDVSPLNESGCVMLVRRESDGELFVKKSTALYAAEVYQQLFCIHADNTPKIYELYQQGNELTVIEEYLPGATLSEHLRDKGVFTTNETIDIAMQLCRILTELHRRNIIHRDIKPSNIILQDDGTLKLIDFNAAKMYEADSGQDTVLLGTAGFAAPEQYGFSSSTPQTDIYALGVLMNVMLCGALPQNKTAVGKLKPVIRRCLKMNPRDRYRDANELYRALKRAKKVISEWLPPGFRTMRIYKMLIAIPCYLLIILVALCIDKEAHTGDAQWNVMRFTFFIMGIFPVLFYCDYMGLQRYFPFMRSQNKKLRILGYILAPLILICLSLSISVTLSLLLML